MEKKKKKPIPEQKPRVIGVGSTGRCVGCTHFSVMMLNYLAGCRRRKAVLLEWNHSGDFEKLERICTGRNREKKRFRILDADYYKAAEPVELAAVLDGNYDDILIDFGVLDEARMPEFLRCEKQFVIGSVTEWQEETFRDFVNRHGAGKKNWICLAKVGNMILLIRVIC